MKGRRLNVGVQTLTNGRRRDKELLEFLVRLDFFPMFYNEVCQFKCCILRKKALKGMSSIFMFGGK